LPAIVYRDTVAIEIASSAARLENREDPMFTKRAFLSAIAGLGATMVIPARARAQSYPQRPIKMVVPGSPGGPVDVLSRLAAHGLQSMLGQSVIIENNAGAGGLLAARAVARAVPDGYTLLFGNTSTFAIIPVTSRNPGYDPARDFAPVAQFATAFQVLVVEPGFPAQSIQDLIQYAKSNPGKLNVAAVYGTLPHLAAEMFKASTGIATVNVPYKGEAESIAAILGKQVQLCFTNVATVLPLISEGRLRALAITSATRQPELPHVPTMIEGGVAGYVVTSFFGAAAPVGTPPEIVQTLYGAINQVLTSATAQRDLARLGVRGSIGSPDDFAAFIAAETRKWKAVATAAEIHID
jgi:tripartite-type tricarboxylate transporter receptor subunit TctC